jgi:hypothetical protein
LNLLSAELRLNGPDSTEASENASSSGGKGLINEALHSQAVFSPIPEFDTLN